MVLGKIATVVCAGDGGVLKVCFRCDECLPLHMFSIRENGVCKRGAYCKDCKRRIAAEYYANNREKCKLSNKKSLAKALEKNPDVIRDKIRRWREKNPDYDTKWRLKVIDRERERTREYAARKRSDNPRAKIDNSMSCGVRGSLVRGTKRGQKWEKLVGYTTSDLMEHLERQFLPGMTWENYGRGGWHVDHVIPKSVFNYTDPTHIDFKKAWALSNLQPLWESDNLSKQDKFSGLFQPSLALAA